jgi:hypothetical protein
MDFGVIRVVFLPKSTVRMVENRGETVFFLTFWMN